MLPAGREELAAWVALPEDPRPVRDPLLLRMRAAAVVGVNGMGAELRRHLALHESQLEEYRGIEERDFTPAPTTECEGRLRHLVLRGGIDLETFWIGWLTRAIGELDAPYSRLPQGVRAPPPYGLGVARTARPYGGEGFRAERRTVRAPGAADDDPGGNRIHHRHRGCGHFARVRGACLGPAEQDHPAYGGRRTEQRQDQADRPALEPFAEEGQADRGGGDRVGEGDDGEWGAEAAPVGGLGEQQAAHGEGGDEQRHRQQPPAEQRAAGSGRCRRP
ncbi:hypothetical protein SBADM41S_11164 [Streptomyces badius]